MYVCTVKESREEVFVPTAIAAIRNHYITSDKKGDGAVVVWMMNRSCPCKGSKARKYVQENRRDVDWIVMDLASNSPRLCDPLYPCHGRHCQSIAVSKHAAEQGFNLGEIVVCAELDETILHHGPEVTRSLNITDCAVEFFSDLIKLRQFFGERVGCGHRCRRRIVRFAGEEVQARSTDLALRRGDARYAVRSRHAL